LLNLSHFYQGFKWSEKEPLALLQSSGGPCSVIAPVQGFFLKRLLFAEEKSADSLPVKLRETINVSISEAEKKNIFIKSLVEMLLQMNKRSWTVCTLNRVNCSAPDSSSSSTSPDETQFETESSISSFHTRLHYQSCESPAELENLVTTSYDEFFSIYGVLLFLCSAITTRGVDVVKNNDDCEIPLVESVHGHGGQSMLNLMLSGEAVTNVFDGVRDVDGYKLKGITNKCQVGFLSLHESYKHCTVGNALKRPEFPLWVVGSETHYSLVFSLERRLVAPVGPKEHATAVFDKYTDEGNGFIQPDMLKEILDELMLFSEPEYIAVVFPSVQSGDIIFRHEFLDVFFPREDQVVLPQTFQLYYYNGLVQSASDNQVRFRGGHANIMDWIDSSHQVSDSQIEDCLKMRFPGVSVAWEDNRAPSLN